MAGSSSEGFEVWLESICQQYQKLSDNEKNVTLDTLIDLSGAAQLHYLSAKVDALFYRDFLKFLPPELREYLLSFLDLKTLLKCCCVCRTWNQIVSLSTSAWLRSCRSYGLIVDREVYNGGHYWKSYLLSMNRRRQQMKTYKCFTSKVYEKYLRRVTAVYYYKGKLAAATESKNIRVWDCNTDQCILMLRTDASVCSLKFDEHYLIASTYIGHLISWDIDCGERLMEYVRHAGAVFTFDYSSHLDLIVSGSSDFKIKIWSLSDAILYRTIHDHECWILKILLKPHPAEEGSIHQEQHILFTMDKLKIVVRFMSFVSNEKVPRGMYLSSIYSIPVNNSDLSFFTPGLHFDGIHLYFICQDQNPGQVSNLYKWHVQQKRMESETAINQNVRIFLGVGEKYMAMVTPWRSSISPTFVVIDKETLEEVALWPLPPSKAASPDCCQIALGESDWLNGLDGRNDQGVLLAAGLDDNTVYAVKWVPRNFENNT